MKIINIYIWDSGGHQLRLKCAQVRHHSPAGTFTRVPGRCLRWSPTPPGPRWPPAKIEVLHLFRWYTHTHAPQQRGRWDDDENEMKVKMEWKLPNQDAKRGTQEKRERANTNTTHLARNGQNPEKARKKEKRRPTDTQPDQRRKGRTEAPEPT